MIFEPERVYHLLKEKYPLRMSHTMAEDDGFTIDVPVLCGKGTIGWFWLYVPQGEHEFCFSYGYEGGHNHTHADSVEQAVDLVERFFNASTLREFWKNGESL